MFVSGQSEETTQLSLSFSLTNKHTNTDTHTLERLNSTLNLVLPDSQLGLSDSSPFYFCPEYSTGRPEPCRQREGTKSV